MANTFFGLTIGASGLTASNMAVNTVAHNIANIKTEGYSRQTTEQKASFGIRVYASYGTVGTGVTVENIVQSRNEYYDGRYRSNNASTGQYDTLNTYSTLIEDYLDEFNLEGFITEYSNYFDAIDQLKANPSGAVQRMQVLSYGSSICQYFNTLSTNLTNVQNDLNTEIATVADKINTIASRIASLNKQINIIQGNGGEANDLKDSRNLLVDELSQYIDTTVDERDLGNGLTDYRVFVNNQTLVNGYSFDSLITTPRANDNKRNASDMEGLYELSWKSGASFNLYENSLKGKLRALIDLRDGCNNAYERVTTNADGSQQLTIEADSFMNSDYKGIAFYQSQLNEFCITFAKEFNDIMMKAQLEDGTQNTEPMFVNQFEEGGYISASSIGVNQKMLDDLTKFPLSYDVAKGKENTDMACEMFDLKEKNTIKSGTFWDYLTSMVSEISVDASRAKTFSQNYTDIQNTIDTQRTSFSGVDEDEEGVDLVKYQNAYNLCSKVISIMNQIYAKLIEETGV